MAEDRVREELAAALPESLGPINLRRPAPPLLDPEAETKGYGDVLLDHLAPVVRRLTAEELRAQAHRLDDGGDEAVEVALGGAAYVHRVLCDRAHELDGEP